MDSTIFSKVNSYNFYDVLDTLAKDIPYIPRVELLKELSFLCSVNAEYIFNTFKKVVNPINCCLCYKGKKSLVPVSIKKVEEVKGESFFDIISYTSGFYNPYFFNDVLKKHQTSLFTDYKALPFVYKKESTFREFLKNRHSSYITTFYGWKSEKVKWNYCSVNSDTYRNLIPEIEKLYMEHKFNVYSRVPPSEAKSCFGDLDSSFDISYPYNYLCYAVDTETNDIVCIGAMGYINNTGFSGSVGLSHDEKYKSFGLVSAAMYYTIKVLFYEFEGIDKIDVGWTGSELGLYKKRFVDEFIDVRCFNNVNTKDMNEWLRNLLKEKNLW